MLKKLSLLLLFSVTVNGGWVDVLQDRGDLVRLQFTLPEYRIDNVSIEGGEYSMVTLPGVVTFLERGYPELPRFSRSLVIPDAGTPALKIIDVEYEVVKINPVLPSKGNLPRTVDPDTIPYEFSDFYATDNWFPEEFVVLHTPFIMRDVRGVTVQVNPFLYNPGQGVLKILKRAVIEVSVSGYIGENVKVRKADGKWSREFSDIYKDMFINFKGTRYDTLEEMAGKMLIISKDSYCDAMQTLVEWKKMKGIPVELVPKSEAGANANQIKNFIQTEYDTSNLVWILLVGDAADVPPAVGMHGSASGNAADPVYTYLEGDDYYPDAFISRFSANSLSDVETQINRSINYELCPDPSGEWYHKGTGIASALSGGGEPYADSTRANWIRDLLLGYTYTEIDRIYAPWATSGLVATAINEGRSIVNYIGHGSTTSWGTTGFSNSNVNALTNVDMLPFVYSVACLNGNFTGSTCFGEAWLRAGTPDAPTGAIAFYGSSINQSWVPPTVSQLHACSLLVADRMNTIGGLAFNGSCRMVEKYLPGMEGVELFETWHIFGDASVQLRTDTPEPMTISHPGVIYIGSSTFDVEVSGVENALVGLYMDSTLYGSGYTDASGYVSVNIEVPLLTPGEMILTVTAYNKLPYQDTIPVIPPGSVTIIPDSVVVSVPTWVRITVLDHEGNPRPDIEVKISGYGATPPLIDTTNTAGLCSLKVDAPYGEVLGVYGRMISEEWTLFEEPLWVVDASDFTSTSLSVSVPSLGLVDTLAPCYEGIINASVSPSGFNLFVSGCGIDTSSYYGGGDAEMVVVPVTSGEVAVCIAKEGYNIEEHTYPVKEFYGTLSGTVTDSVNGSLIGGALVRIYDIPVKTLVFEGETDDSGVYVVPDSLPVGYYDVEVTSFGYEEYCDTF
ncbi:hypothetical protein CH333_02180, partial [candidate division WOR-3 bacterium JGI_Cruoil_03_44_89]